MKYTPALLFVIVMRTAGFAQSPVDAQTVKVNGIDLYYEVYGKGEPLLLLHGWTQSSTFWDPYIPVYAQYFSVYAIDLRGHGRSSPLSDGFSIQKTADDVLALLDLLQMQQVRAIGLSFGGLALLELAHSHPDRITSMILIGAAPQYDGAEQSSGSISLEDLPASFREHLQTIHRHGDGQIRALFNPDLNYRISLSNEDLQNIDSQTLIVQGDRDEIVGVAPAFTLHQYLPHSSLWIVPATGHLAITDSNKARFLQISTDFLTGADR